MFQNIIENQPHHIVLHLFGKQNLNIPKTVLTKPYYEFFYKLNLLKLRILCKRRKIRVGFWVTETSKWTCERLYEELKNDSDFEPFILLSYYKRPQEDASPKEHYSKTKEYFKSTGAKFYDTYNVENGEFKELSEFKPDIIFYQQPWLIPEKQVLAKNHKKSLLCYVPYCFYSMDSYLNYLPKFHGVLWKYFVETDLHKKEYENKYHAFNCITTGSVKLDTYHYIETQQTPERKQIIYAPHHSFNDGMHELATFKENGAFILDLAKKHPEYDWIFRPHPLFKDRLIKNSIMTENKIDDYYNEWKNIGTLSEGGNYYEMFSRSDLLITDCISFLAEYAPTQKPVFHLRKDYQKEDFNNLVKEIDKSYYQVYSNEELEKLFEQVVVQGDDYLKEKRKINLELLPIKELASINIYNYLKKIIFTK